MVRYYLGPLATTLSVITYSTSPLQVRRQRLLVPKKRFSHHGTTISGQRFPERVSTAKNISDQGDADRTGASRISEPFRRRATAIASVMLGGGGDGAGVPPVNTCCQSLQMPLKGSPRRGSILVASTMSRYCQFSSFSLSQARFGALGHFPGFLKGRSGVSLDDPYSETLFFTFGCTQTDYSIWHLSWSFLAHDTKNSQQAEDDIREQRVIPQNSSTMPRA